MKHESPRRGLRATGEGRVESYSDATEVDRILEAAARFKIAARQIVDDPELDFRGRCLRLLDLSREAPQQMPVGFADAVVWREVRHLFAPAGVPRTLIEACRALLRRGLVDCPTCKRPLPRHDELDRWLRLELTMMKRAS